MGNINYGRVLLGALVAGIVYFVGDGLIHGGILSGDYAEMMKSLGKPMEQDNASYGYFAIFDYGKALVAMYFYAVARTRLGPGVKTAVCAGLVAWFACEFVPAVSAMTFPFFPSKWFYVKVMALSVVPMVLGAVAGAFLYKEEKAA